MSDDPKPAPIYTPETPHALRDGLLRGWATHMTARKSATAPDIYRGVTPSDHGPVRWRIGMSVAERLSDLAQAIRVAAMAQGGLTKRQAKALADDLADIAAEMRRAATRDAVRAAEVGYRTRKESA